MEQLVHAVSYASQPDIQIRCTKVATTPKWGGAKTEQSSVYLAENGDRYTFDEDLVTCLQCLSSFKPLPGHFVGNFEVVDKTDDFTVIAPTTHVWKRQRSGGSPSEPNEWIVHCEHCGVEQTDDNVTEACE